MGRLLPLSYAWLPLLYYASLFRAAKSYEPSSKELFISLLLNRAGSAGIRHQPANFISETSQVTLHPIQGYGDYFFPLWQMSIVRADNPTFAQPKQSQPLVIITDSEIAHRKFLPAGWTGTDETTYRIPTDEDFQCATVSIDTSP